MLTLGKGKRVTTRFREVITRLLRKTTTFRKMIEAYEHQILALQEDLVNYDGMLNVVVVDSKLKEVAEDYEAIPSAMTDILSRGRSVFRVEDGEAIAFSDEGRQMYERDAVTPLSIHGWMRDLKRNYPHLFKQKEVVRSTMELSTHDSILAGLAGLERR